MSLLKDLLYKASPTSVSGDMSAKINGISFDSRKVKPGHLFVAVKGLQVDGHEYIGQAIENGAIAVVCQAEPSSMKHQIAYVTVENSAKTLGIVSSNFFGNPSTKLRLVGITGTNGKTTTATLLQHVHLNLGYNSGLISTVENRINDQVIESDYTTPDALQLNKLLQQMVNRGCTHCFMEVSSHALAQHRIAGLSFEGAVFTNITHDHLDYHGSFDEYIAIKKSLFDGLPSNSFALVNKDDKRGQIMTQNSKAKKYTYTLKSIGDFKAKMLSHTLMGTELEINQNIVWFKLVGDFNAYNLLAAYATARLLGEDDHEVLTSLSEAGTAPGRFEQVTIDSKVIGIIDYAHTPDALKKVLGAIKGVRSGNEKLITVVGCGGNRDRAKRPLMAQIACENSDQVILTSDNPRDEKPEDIIDEMRKGISPVQSKKAISISDRKEAIKTACALATNHDIILVAGRGHEAYQEIKGQKYPFDDRQVLLEMLKLSKN